MSKIASLMPTREDWKRIIGPIIRGTALGSFLGIFSRRRRASLLLHRILRGEKDIQARSGVRYRRHRRRGGTRGGQQRRSPNLLHPHAHPRHSHQPCHGSHDRSLGDPGPATRSRDDHRTAAAFLGRHRSMWIGNVMLLVLNLPLIGIWVEALPGAVPPSLSGNPRLLRYRAFSLSNSEFDIHLMAFFGHRRVPLRQSWSCEAGAHAARHDSGTDDGRAPAAPCAAVSRGDPPSFSDGLSAWSFSLSPL